MGKTTSDRRARVEKMRAEQARRDRRSRLLIYGAGVAVVALVVGAVGWAVATRPSSASTAASSSTSSSAAASSSSGAPSSSASAAAIPGLKTYTGLSRDHTTAKVTYAQNPPVGGAHAPIWQNCGWYSGQVANENAVHSLEHGAVWVTYSPNLSSSDRATLKQELSGKQYVVASEYPGLPGPVVASAWGKQVVLDGVKDPRLMEFVNDFAGSPSAPEPGGECAGGVGNPS